MDKKEIKISSILHEIYDELTWGYIAEKYFDQSAMWLYNKTFEIEVDGDIQKFTSEEIEILKGALIDTADRIRKTADKL